MYASPFDSQLPSGKRRTLPSIVGGFGNVLPAGSHSRTLLAPIPQATKPIVVRLDGNNVAEGRRILAEANHPLVTVVATMDEAADKAAELANR